MRRGTTTALAIAVIAAIASCRRDKPADAPPAPIAEPAPPAAPAPAPVTFTAAPDAPAPPPVVLRQIRTFGGSNGQTWAIMEVVNQTDRPVVPAIRFNYRDGSGQPVSEDASGEGCPIPMLVLRASEKIPCFTKLPRGAATATYDVALQKEPAELLARDRRADLQVVGAKLESAGGPSLLGARNQIVGFVQNQAAVPLSRIQVQASFYDAAGKLVGHGEMKLADKEIKPGARAPFQLLAKVMLAPAATFSATAWTLKPAK